MPTLRNNYCRVIAVAGLPIPPGRIASVPATHYQSWLRRSAHNSYLANQYLQIVEEKELAEDYIPPKHAPPVTTTPQEFPVAELDQNRAVDIPTITDTPEDVRLQKIRDGIVSLQEEDRRGNFNKDGTPNINRLRRIANLDDITDDERRDAWASVNKNPDV